MRDDKITGGQADQNSFLDFDRNDLLQGVEVELEHTDDIVTAAEIAADHLKEDPEYYKNLAKWHVDESNGESCPVHEYVNGGIPNNFKENSTNFEKGISYIIEACQAIMSKLHYATQNRYELNQNSKQFIYEKVILIQKFIKIYDSPKMHKELDKLYDFQTKKESIERIRNNFSELFTLMSKNKMLVNNSSMPKSIKELANQVYKFIYSISFYGRSFKPYMYILKNKSSNKNLKNISKKTNNLEEISTMGGGNVEGAPGVAKNDPWTTGKVYTLKEVLLQEDRKDFLRDKYAEPLAQHMNNENPGAGDAYLDKLFEVDPTHNKKYTQWMIKYILSQEDYLAAWNKVIDLEDYLEDFEDFKNRNIIRGADINQMTPTDVIELVQKHQDEMSNREKRGKSSSARKEIWEKEVELIHRDKEWMLAKPLTERASCYLGKGTSWCTAADSGQNAFTSYVDTDNPDNAWDALYVFYNRKTDEKWQFHPSSEELSNEENLRVNRTDFKIHHNDIWEKLLEYLYKNYKKTGRRSSAKFFDEIKEYGFKKEIESNPDKKYEELLQQIIDGDLEGDLNAPVALPEVKNTLLALEVIVPFLNKEQKQKLFEAIRSSVTDETMLRLLSMWMSSGSFSVISKRFMKFCLAMDTSQLINNLDKFYEQGNKSAEVAKMLIDFYKKQVNSATIKKVVEENKEKIIKLAEYYLSRHPVDFETAQEDYIDNLKKVRFLFNPTHGSSINIFAYIDLEKIKGFNNFKDEILNNFIAEVQGAAHATEDIDNWRESRGLYEYIAPIAEFVLMSAEFSEKQREEFTFEFCTDAPHLARNFLFDRYNWRGREQLVELENSKFKRILTSWVENLQDQDINKMYSKLEKIIFQKFKNLLMSQHAQIMKDERDGLIKGQTFLDQIYKETKRLNNTDIYKNVLYMRDLAVNLTGEISINFDYIIQLIGPENNLINSYYWDKTLGRLIKYGEKDLEAQDDSND